MTAVWYLQRLAGLAGAFCHALVVGLALPCLALHFRVVLGWDMMCPALAEGSRRASLLQGRPSSRSMCW